MGDAEMLHDFLRANRRILIDRCRSKAAFRPTSESRSHHAEPEHGIPLFLDQLIRALQVEQTVGQMRSRKASDPAGGDKSVLSEIREAAAKHGRELWRQGFTIEQVVHGYGDVCQAITDLAFESDAPVRVDEFRTLNGCLDNAIADAVTEFSYRRELLSADQAADSERQRFGYLVHELRNLVHSAALALSAVRAGSVGLSGATGAVLDRSMTGLRHLSERSVAEMRRTAPVPARHERLSLADLIAEAGAFAALEADARGCKLTVSRVDPSLVLDVDREQLLSALRNVLQNAFKFTRPGTEVTLSAYASADRIWIDVEDHCGGLPDGAAARMFLPFRQHGADRSGLGLGLSSCQRNVEASGGTLGVRDLPGSGCIFTIGLPRANSGEMRSSDRVTRTG
jgi:hypothetical protein